jgi:hypothetical protein
MRLRDGVRIQLLLGLTSPRSAPVSKYSRVNSSILLDTSLSMAWVGAQAWSFPESARDLGADAHYRECPNARVADRVVERGYGLTHHMRF